MTAQIPSPPSPRLYLVTPQIDDAEALVPVLTEMLDNADIAAVLLRLAPADERTLINRAKKFAPLVQSRGAALLLNGHPELVARAGADGAHLTGLAQFEAAAGELKPTWIAGCGGLASRHDSIMAAERGADYVMFGEPDAQGHRPGLAAIEDRVAWWAEVFETPCVGYAAQVEDIESLVAAGADFIAVGEFVWGPSRTPIGTVTQRLKRSG